MLGEFPDDETQTPPVQLVAPDLPPLCRKVAPRPVEGLGDVEDVLFGAETMSNSAWLAPPWPWPLPVAGHVHRKRQANPEAGQAIPELH